MAEAGCLQIVPGFFGADTAITNFNASRLPWVATLITTGNSRQHAWLRRRQVIDKIRSCVEELAGRIPASGSTT
jgi:3-methylornithine--L-lysine ligase